MTIRLLILVGIVSGFGIADSSRGLTVLSAVIALATLGAGILAPPSALTRLGTLLRPSFIIILAAPALWMIFQMVPIPVGGLGNPIWATASATLNQPLAERITVDITATMLALAQYSDVIAIGLVTAVVALDRQRAAHLLYILASVATLVSALSIGERFGSLSRFFLDGPASGVMDHSTAAVLGILLSLAVAIRSSDQLIRRSQASGFARGSMLTLSAAVLSLLLCTLVIVVRGNAADFIAALLGAELLLAIVAIRKWFFGLWGTAGVLGTVLVIFTATLTAVPLRRDVDLTVAFSAQDHSATERMLQDTRSGGSGAGAFNALLPIYRDVATAGLHERPTAAAAIAIDMGRPFLCGLFGAAALGAAILFKRSLARRYDYVYAALGAATSMAVPILAFAEGNILDLGASLLLAALYGLAFGQSLTSAAPEIISLAPEELSAEAGNTRRVDRPTAPSAFGSTWMRAAFVLIGVLLIAQPTWVLSHSLHSVTGFSTAPASIPREDSLERPLTSAMVAPAGPNSAGRPPAEKPAEETTSVGNQLSADRLVPDVFTSALRYSPLRGDLWLMLAATSQRYKWSQYDTTALLRMSYYTAPNDLDLFAPRLSVALASDDAVRDSELRDLINRDLEIIITHQPALRPALLAAYRSASANGKAFAEHSISQFAPGYFASMRGPGP